MLTQQSLKKLLPDHEMGVQDGTSPCAVTFNDKLYLFWNGSGKNGIFFTHCDGTNWKNQHSLKQLLPDHEMGIQDGTSPCAVTFNGKLYLFWNGSGKNGIFFTYDDGTNCTNWKNQQSLKQLLPDHEMGVQDGTSPCAVTFNDKLYLFWNGSGKNGIFFTYDDGTDCTNWKNQQSLKQLLPDREMGVQDGTSPCAVTFNGKLYLFWNGSGNNGIFFTYDDGTDCTNWKNQQSLKQLLSDHEMGVQDGTSPCAVTFNGKLYLFWNGSGNNGIFFTSYDGKDWQVQQSVKQLLSNHEMGLQDRTSPATSISINNLIYLFWNGSGKDGIWFTDLIFANSWMTKLKPQTNISEINLPGSHDSASINNSSWYPDTSYTTQHLSITNQLKSGIRLLDVRLKVKLEPMPKSGGYKYNFVTCHGIIGINEYKSFESLMQECTSFLDEQNSEFLVILLKIDDWNKLDKDATTKNDVLKNLSQFLQKYNNKIYSSPGLPTLKDVQGKIFLLNRISSNAIGIGKYISWDDNASGKFYQSSPFSYYVQDQYKGLSTINPESDKAKIYMDAMKNFKPSGNDVLINFGSATYFGFLPKPLIQRDILNAFGKYDGKSRETNIGRFGWTFFDYADLVFKTSNVGTLTIVDFIISSNFDEYENFASQFEVIEDRKTEL